MADVLVTSSEHLENTLDVCLMSFQDRPYYIPLPMNSSFFWGGAGIEGMV